MPGAGYRLERFVWLMVPEGYESIMAGKPGSKPQNWWLEEKQGIMS